MYEVYTDLPVSVSDGAEEGDDASSVRLSHSCSLFQQQATDLQFTPTWGRRQSWTHKRLRHDEGNVHFYQTRGFWSILKHFWCNRTKVMNDEADILNNLYLDDLKANNILQLTKTKPSQKSLVNSDTYLILKTF